MPAKLYFTEDEKQQAKKAKDKRYREKHRAAVTARMRSWRQRNPEKVKKTYLKRRANCTAYRKHRTYGKVLLADISNYNSRICGICSLKITGKFEIDHIIPVNRGGNSCIENLQLAHPICNRLKSDKLQIELDTSIFKLKVMSYL